MGRSHRAKPRTFVAQCTHGCTHNGAPRLVDADELAAHDEEHMASKLRFAVRTLRGFTPEVLQAAHDYITAGDLHAAKKLAAPITEATPGDYARGAGHWAPPGAAAVTTEEA